MKNFFTIFKFELLNFIQSKSYIISTAIIAAILAVVMFLPNFVDLGLTDDSSTNYSEDADTESGKEADKTDDSEATDTTYVIFDKTNSLPSAKELTEQFKSSGITWENAQSVDELKNDVKKQNYDAGFVINSFTDYDYYVYNKEMFDFSDTIIDDFLTTVYRNNYCAENNIDYELVEPLINVNINCNENVLGKDAADSYWYCYALTIIVFMLIILYGTLIATAVTNEKSNRSIEVLVTSTSTDSLLFGKVLAGTVASFVQIAIILTISLGGYKLNENAWGHALDMLLKIKPEVLVTFALFGVTGFIFYAFLYGVMGALVSKTEDINKSAGSLQMIIMIVYFVVLFQMSNIDGIAMKVASFLPVSSYSAMYIRVAMGNVALWEIIVSYIILVISTIAVGYIGAKIYRLGTLRYGNPIKISTALKSIKNKEQE